MLTETVSPTPATRQPERNGAGAVRRAPQVEGTQREGLELLDSISACASATRGSQAARILIADDDPFSVVSIRKFLAGLGYRDFVTADVSPEAVARVKEADPDLILLDVMMHGPGLSLLRAIKADRELKSTPVIVLTASNQPAVKTEALEYGATDFLSKPVEPSELAPRVRNVLSAKAHQDELEAEALDLKKKVEQQLAELDATRREVIFCLGRAAEFRDDETGRHVLRVGRYAGIIARQMGLDEVRAADIELAAQLHDVGKIGIPDAILLKPGKLEPEEFDLMRRHCKFGRDIIKPVSEEELDHRREHTMFGAEILNAATSPILRLASTIAQTHHERWDGTGYPLGLAGEDIPLEGRITSVADVFDALSSERPYKRPFPREKCFEIIQEGRGTQFDPEVVDAFFARSGEIVNVQLQFMD